MLSTEHTVSRWFSLSPSHQFHCTDVWVPMTPWDTDHKSFCTWENTVGRNTLSGFYRYLLNPRFLYYVEETFYMQKEKMFICKSISRAVSTSRTDPLRIWGSPDALHHINFYWLQQKLRTSGPCAISPYCSIHMACFLCLWGGFFYLFCFLKRVAANHHCVSMPWRKQWSCILKKHNWSVWIQDFSPALFSGAISNINLWSEDLQTLKLKSKTYL